MDKSTHTLCDLFKQLGLPSDAAEVDAFIASHRPLDSAVKLSDAPFWNPAQRTLLRQQIEADADWAAWVDGLDARLR